MTQGPQHVLTVIPGLGDERHLSVRNFDKNGNWWNVDLAPIDLSGCEFSVVMPEAWESCPLGV